MTNEYKSFLFNFWTDVFSFVSNKTWDLIVLSGLDKIVDFYGSDFVNLNYGATSISENIFYVYNTIMFIELFVLVVVLWIIFMALYSFKDNSLNGLVNRYTVHYGLYKNKEFFTSKVLEFFWTLLPIAILFYIGYPSLVLVYSLEERINPELVVKVIGHQWYWHYEVEGSNLQFNYVEPEGWPEYVFINGLLFRF